VRGNANGTIAQSMGVSSVSRSSAGQYIVTLSTPAPNQNFAVLGSTHVWMSSFSALSTSQIRVNTANSGPTYVDADFTVAVFYN
jgi:hypothetical protein